jgi:aminopeptidase YwaD
MDDTLQAELMAHLHKLSVEIGSRMMGTPADHAAADYVRQVFTEAGLAVDEHRWDCTYWTAEETVLEVDGQAFAAQANTFSLPCDVTLPTVGIGTEAELQAADLHGKIGIVYGELASTPLTNINYIVYNPERDLRVNRLLQAKQPAALITFEPFNPVFEPLIQDRDIGIPSATVWHESGLRLMSHVGANTHLKIVSRSVPSTSANIIGRTAKQGDNRLVVCAHYDTKINTPGAVDNGAGASALLALAKRLVDADLDIPLELVAFGGEEYYASGDVKYARRMAGTFENVIAAINMDGVGQRVGSNSVTMMSESDAFHGMVTDLIKRYPGMTWTAPWPASNHYTFYSRGVPSIALSSKGVVNIWHTPKDTIDWVSEDKLAEVVQWVLDIVGHLHDKSTAWTRPASAG